jgi:predicted alpha/beta superfamily hydrolase
MMAAGVRRRAVALSCALAALASHGGSDELGRSESVSAPASSSAGGTASVGAVGGGASTTSASGTGGTGGTGGQTPSTLDALLESLRADPDAALLAQSRGDGWPAPVAGGHLVVSTSSLNRVAGDFDGWTGTPTKVDAGFAWLVLPGGTSGGYKLTDGTSYLADPWARAYRYDAFGEMSLVAPSGAHLERHLQVAGAGLEARTVRVWLPAAAASHVLYVHDGQALFDPAAAYGGLSLQQAAPAGMMIVGIDNSTARMDEYTHVQDRVAGQLVGGQADAYADFLHVTVRALVSQHYGEPARVGVMGSSLGGLVSFHVAQRYDGAYHFAASLSGTMGWGSIDAAAMPGLTMIDRYAAAAKGAAALYLDSGGNGSCVDSDGDGIEDDDPLSRDNYCTNLQLADVLRAKGYSDGVDLQHWWEPDAPHNEAAWAARVWRPLEFFATL